jgi:hypothetical protein
MELSERATPAVGERTPPEQGRGPATPPSWLVLEEETRATHLPLPAPRTGCARLAVARGGGAGQRRNEGTPSRRGGSCGSHDGCMERCMDKHVTCDGRGTCDECGDGGGGRPEVTSGSVISTYMCPTWHEVVPIGPLPRAPRSAWGCSRHLDARPIRCPLERDEGWRWEVRCGAPQMNTAGRCVLLQLGSLRLASSL